MRSPSGWLTACSCALVLAGCGDGGAKPKPRGPAVPKPLANRLAEQSDAVAAKLVAGDRCGAAAAAAKLRADTTAAINAGRVPPPFQENLSSAVSDLVLRVGRCAAPPAPEKEHHGKGKAKGKHKHGKGEGE
jgi:hypothetical protein